MSSANFCINTEIKSTFCIPSFPEFDNYEGYNDGTDSGAVVFNTGSETGEIKVIEY